MTVLKRLAFVAVAFTVTCGDQEMPTEPARGPSASMQLSASDSAGPTIVTDKEDYVPNETVAMIGSGWEPGETVALTLTEDPDICGDRTFTVTADSLGNFVFDEFAPEDHHAGVSFVLTAVGQSSGLQAETRFTDSVARVGTPVPNFNGTGGLNPSRLMLSAPATNPGDLLIAQVTVAKDIASTEVICPPGPPGAWVSVLKTKWSNTGTSKINQEIFYHVATSAEVAQTYTWVFKQNNDCNGSNSPARGAAGGITHYTGVDVTPATDAIRGFGGAGTGSGSSTKAKAPSVSGVSTGDRIIRFFGAFKNTSFTPVTGRLYTIGSANNSSERTAAAFDADQGAGTSTGEFEATLASSAEWLAQTVVLKMAVACTAPAITTDPLSATKTVGESVTFSVTATGTGLAYQWRKDGVNIGTATSDSYTIPSVTTGDEGSYDVVITGTCGSVTSDAATLIVNKRATATDVTSSPSNPSVFGQSVTFEATVSPTSGNGTPTGSVTFIEGGTCDSPTTTHAGPIVLSSGQADFSTGGLSVGAHTIIACYEDDATFSPSNGFVTQTVERAYTTTSISSVSPSGSQYVNGQVTVNFNVTVSIPGSGTPNGNVEVKNGTTVLCSAALPATSCSFTPTTVAGLSLVASYVGDDNFRPSASAGATYTVKYQFLGFFPPVDKPNTLNVSKAGQAVPLKWRLLDADGAPITTLTAVNIKIGSLACTSTTPTDLIEEYASGSTGLQNDGDGYYQFNWKSPTSYANSCRTVGLDFGSGYLEYPLANFNFKK